jgi:hypothetical protein
LQEQTKNLKFLIVFTLLLSKQSRWGAVSSIEYTRPLTIIFDLSASNQMLTIVDPLDPIIFPSSSFNIQKNALEVVQARICLVRLFKL